jgi:hypothetical protein
LMSLAEGTSVASIAARLAGAVTTGSSDGELMARVARHEGVEDASCSAKGGRGASSMLEAKSVAAE